MVRILKLWLALMIGIYIEQPAKLKGTDWCFSLLGAILLLKKGDFSGVVSVNLVIKGEEKMG